MKPSTQRTGDQESWPTTQEFLDARLTFDEVQEFEDILLDDHGFSSSFPWPHATKILAAARASIELRGEIKIEQVAGRMLAKRVSELLQEIDRHHKDFAKWEDMADRAVARAVRAEDRVTQLEHEIYDLYVDNDE